MPDENSKKSKHGDLTWGIVLVVLGVLFLLDKMDIADFGDVVRTFWPVALIALGLKLVMVRGESKPRAKKVEKAAELVQVSGDEPIRYSKVIGDWRLKIDSTKFGGGTVSTVVGDVNIDLSDVNVVGGQKLIRVSGVIGDVFITAPSKLKYSVQANAVVGDVNLIDTSDSGFSVNKGHQSAGFQTAKKRLVISISQVIGDIDVVEAPSQSTKK